MNADEAIPEPEENDDRMVVNSVGSFVWRVDDMNRLRRFLILGSEYATYYIGERTLGRENARAISNLLQGGRGVDVVNEILRFSTQGRTTKQDPIMFALAMCAREGDLPTKRRAYEILPQVCRIPTHLFMFVGFCETLSRPSTGWSRAHRNAMKKWYIIKARDDPMKLAMDVTKYRKREGWSHRDVARLTHLNPVAANVPDGLFAIMMYIAQGWNEAMNQFYFPENGIPPGRSATTNAVLEFLNAVEAVKQFRVDNIPQVVNLILTHNLVREHIPTECLRSIEVWSALLRQMPMTAMIRNLGEMTSIHGLLAGSPEERLICDRLQNVQLLRHARIHPFNVLVALKTYADGHGDRGRLVWIPNEEILEALKNAFYNSFQHVESTKKRYLLALDVSVSMSYAAGSHIAPNDASAAMSMVVARTETEYHIVAFSNEIISLRELVIDENTTLDEVLQLMQQIPRRAADCALPMKYAIENDLDVDVFVVYTDCETRKVGIQPSEALRQYREHSGIRDAKLIVVAMTSNGFTIADPDDPGMLDMAGFDSAAPEVMREFILGNI